MAKKLISAYLITLGLQNFFFSFTFTTYVLFVLDNGYDLFDANALNLIFMGVVFFGEIPTGVFADFLGRKVSVLIAMIFNCIGLLIYGLSKTFFGFVAAEIVIGLGHCFFSGAFDVLLKDNLDNYQYEPDIGRIFSKGYMISQLTKIGGGALGGLIAVCDLRVQWFFAAFGEFAGFWLILIFIKEENFTPTEISKAAIKKVFCSIVRSGWKYGRKQKKVWNAILLGAVFMLAVQSLNMLWAPFVKENLGVQALSHGWVGICVGLFFGGAIAERKVTGGNHLQLLRNSVVIVFVFIVLAAILENAWLVLIFIWLQEIGRGMFTPIHNAFIHNNIPSGVRATVSSFSSMISKGGAAVGLFFSGMLSVEFGIQQTWLMSALIISMCLLFVCRINKS